MKIRMQMGAFIAALQVVFSTPLLPAQAQGEKASARAQAQAEMKEVLVNYDAGNYQKAMELCKKVLTTEPTNLTAHYVMGNICVKCHQVSDAVAQYKYCIQSPEGKNSSETAYARTALRQIREQNRATGPGFAPVPANGQGQYDMRSGSMTSSSKSSDQYIQEQTDILTKEAKEQIAVKKRTLDDKIKQIQDEMREQMSGFQPFTSRKVAARTAVSEAQDQVKQEGQGRIDQLKNEFERQSEDINQAFQSRISALSEHYHNLDSRSGGRSGNH